MGLNFADSDAQWSYGGFGRFRERLADAEGFDLNAMYGFGGETEWSEVETDLEPLLNHSDCDGSMTWQECEQVYPRLLQIVKTWENENDPLDYDAKMGRVLAETMIERVIAKQQLVFC